MGPFATFAMQHPVKSIRDIYEICERELKNAKEIFNAFATIAKEILGLARA